MSECGAKGKPFSGPFRPRPVTEAFSRRANHQFTLVVLIYGATENRTPIVCMPCKCNPIILWPLYLKRYIQLYDLYISKSSEVGFKSRNTKHPTILLFQKRRGRTKSLFSAFCREKVLLIVLIYKKLIPILS